MDRKAVMYKDEWLRAIEEERKKAADKKRSELEQKKVQQQSAAENASEHEVDLFAD